MRRAAKDVAPGIRFDGVKKRPQAHLIDEAGATLLRKVLPPEWVIREYRPDYGIDFAVEVFDRSKTNELTSLGEQFFVQLKSRSNIAPITKTVQARFNVEKEPLRYNTADERTIAVLPISIETSCLELARSMGPAVPLLLIVADINLSELHWVCLTDFVDKVLVPQSPNFELQASHTVYIPVRNRLDTSEAGLIPIRFFARRAKLYAAFNRFRYQRHEIRYALDRAQLTPDHQLAESDLIGLASHFLNLSSAYDFWQTTHAWPSVGLTYLHVVSLANVIERVRSGESPGTIFLSQLNGVPITSEAKPELARFLLTSKIAATFDLLANLGNMFEELCREWHLPTYLGDLAEEHAIR